MKDRQLALAVFIPVKSMVCGKYSLDVVHH